jgi:hypothetical protein
MMFAMQFFVGATIYQCLPLTNNGLHTILAGYFGA